MPRVTIEKKVQVSGDVYEIKTKTYELPNSISLYGVYMTYNKERKAYESLNKFTTLPAETYIQIQQKTKKQSKQKGNEI